MQLNTAQKRAAVCSWCKHTDNNYGGRTKKSVRAGKRALRKRLNTYLNKLLRYDD